MISRDATMFCWQCYPGVEKKIEPGFSLNSPAIPLFRWHSRIFETINRFVDREFKRSKFPRLLERWTNRHGRWRCRKRDSWTHDKRAFGKSWKTLERWAKVLINYGRSANLCVQTLAAAVRERSKR